MDRFLIDECLSARLVAIAKERHFDAQFGPHIGKSGWQDWNLAQFAIENDYVLVTNNRRDFLKIYSSLPLHNGLVVLVPNVERARQVALFELVLDHLAKMNDRLVNKLVEILGDGSIHERDWSSAEFDPQHTSHPHWR